ncbi:maleylpyruvate isomerase N-terminal domain-containing protein [Actinoplanes sp. NPDC051633]|uniref:maleylpyruvate isomerase N-terminal domain-containing protein n=1 Tax=Actinoplanes sp. NPDC051633 TaxID=3155670 RepID=UPI0034468241
MPDQHPPPRLWQAADRTGGPLDDVLDVLRRRYFGLVVHRLGKNHSADDDNVYFIGLGRNLDMVQVDTGPNGQPPFTVEAHARIDTDEPTEALAAIQDHLAVNAGDLPSALNALSGALGPAVDRDWSARADTLGWDCWHTAEHIGDVLLSYAAQVVARPTTRYVRFLASADTDATAAEVLEFALTGGGILDAAVRAAPPTLRAYHPTGMADAEGFAAMGCVEALVHGYDIAQGLGVDLTAPPGVCARVLARLFPDTPDTLADRDSWSTLLWVTGRVDLPGRPRRSEEWQWHGAPLGDS